MGNRVPCTRCVSYTRYLAHGNSKGEARGRNRHKSNSKIVLRNMEERIMETKGKSPKQDLTIENNNQGLTSTEDLSIELPEGRDSPTMDHTNLT